MAREVGAKIVFYGPGLSGKTTTLRKIYESVRPAHRGEMMSLATEGDRTLFFDFLPVKVEKVGDCTVRLALYTVPGQVFYNATRKLVLQGADGVVFVADSQPAAADSNRESLMNLEDNLLEHGLQPDRFPLVIQYNKRDVAGVMPVSQLRAMLNPRGVPDFETSATSGRGVLDGLKAITRLVIQDLKEKRIVPSSRTAGLSTTRTPIPNPESPGFGPRPASEGLASLGATLDGRESDPTEAAPRPVPRSLPTPIPPSMTPAAHLQGQAPARAPSVQAGQALIAKVPVREGLAEPLSGQRMLGVLSALAPQVLLDHALAAEAAFNEGRFDACVRASREGVRRALSQAGDGSEREQAYLLRVDGPDLLRLQGMEGKLPCRVDDAAFALYVFAQVLARLSDAGLPD